MFRMQGSGIACGFKDSIEIKCEQASNSLIQLENQGLTYAFCGHVSKCFELRSKAHGRHKSWDQPST